MCEHFRVLLAGSEKLGDRSSWLSDLIARRPDLLFRSVKESILWSWPALQVSEGINSSIRDLRTDQFHHSDLLFRSVAK
jgi:hypothetical protein